MRCQTGIRIGHEGYYSNRRTIEGYMLVNSVEITEISVKLVNLKNSVKFSKIQ